jgi:pyruvate formate lyase activating enzyme
MKIAGLVKTTLRDWEGRNACKVLCVGCNFKCPYCNSPNLIGGCEDLEGLDQKEVFDYITDKKDFLEAIVISGGEPTQNIDLYRFLRDLKKTGLLIKIDTNGSYPCNLDDIIGAGLVDKVCMNVMAPLNTSEYSTAAGVTVDMDDIRKSIRIIMDSGIDYEFRTVAVPGIVDTDTIGAIARGIDGARCYILQQFDQRNVADPRLRSVIPYTGTELARISSSARGYVKRMKVRGL